VLGRRLFGVLLQIGDDGLGDGIIRCVQQKQLLQISTKSFTLSEITTGAPPLGC
jgi:hypothetical protein